MKTTSKVAASFLAMALGWIVMMIILTVFMLASAPAWSSLGDLTIIGIYSFFVVLGAWFIVCLPLYILIPNNCFLFEWYVGGPIGACVGFLAGYLLIGHIGFCCLAMTVGGVAGGIGRLFIEDPGYKAPQI
ncbi:hypothetical protein JO972_06285 [Verrucomicrobiaceae bacterium 5K15]|uniref:Uncharacterized protein n=1 Tax=Oceaniferula flava TaxID=2800421 RepID=A0AAE2SB06_9BACT|nr:hypothetical protein [Oceaniferula flavus]MBK1854558.1 hypothetical protein [Oceaniferula flavus]MBM1135864.1 hypothetical protein [Oceaniferula flavus]